MPIIASPEANMRYRGLVDQHATGGNHLRVVEWFRQDREPSVEMSAFRLLPLHGEDVLSPSVPSSTYLTTHLSNCPVTARAAGGHRHEIGEALGSGMVSTPARRPHSRELVVAVLVAVMKNHEPRYGAAAARPVAGADEGVWRNGD